jgi:hypothetical protein
VSAVDVNGMFVAAAFECQPEALYVEELELSAPLVAEPTLRGVRRVSPGTPLPAPAPIWIKCDAAGAAEEVWAAAGSAHPATGDTPRLGIRRSASLRTVEAFTRG